MTRFKTYLLTITLLLLSVIAMGQIGVGTNFKVTGQLPIDVRFVAVDTISRDAINANYRYEGLTVFVQSTGKTYQLVGGITNSDWKVFGEVTPSQWLNNADDIYYSLGKVGVGTSAPQATIDINGNIRLTNVPVIAGHPDTVLVYDNNTGVISKMAYADCVFDTTSLDGRINLKQNYTDTTTYDATRYWVIQQGYSTGGADSAYIQSYVSARLDSVVYIEDSLTTYVTPKQLSDSLSNRIDAKLAKADSNLYATQYDLGAAIAAVPQVIERVNTPDGYGLSPVTPGDFIATEKFIVNNNGEIKLGSAGKIDQTGNWSTRWYMFRNNMGIPAAAEINITTESQPSIKHYVSYDEQQAEITMDERSMYPSIGQVNLGRSDSPFDTMFVSNIVSGSLTAKVNVADSNLYATQYDLGAAIAAVPQVDTTSLSNRIDAKLAKADSTLYATRYWVIQQGYSTGGATYTATNPIVITDDDIAIKSDTLESWWEKQNQGAEAYSWGNHAGLYLTTATLNDTVKAKVVEYQSIPANNGASGDIITMSSTVALQLGDVVFVGSSGGVVLCKADAIANCPYAFAIVIEGIEENGQGYLMTRGALRNNSWNWTPGSLLYIKNNAVSGDCLTDTPPSGSNNVIMPVAVALSSTTIYFTGNLNSVEKK